MSLFTGTNIDQVDDVYLGTTAFDKIYLGDEKLWPTGPSQVVYEATGTGGSTSSGTSVSWTHTSAGDEFTCVVIFMSGAFGGGLTVDYGGVPGLYKGNNGLITAFAVMNPPPGPQTVSISGGLARAIVANSISYTGVGVVRGHYTRGQSGTAASGLTATTVPTSLATEMVIMGFSNAYSGGPSPYVVSNFTGGNLRYSLGVSGGQGSSLLIGDVAGVNNGPVTGTASRSTTATTPSTYALALRLVPVVDQSPIVRVGVGLDANAGTAMPAHQAGDLLVANGMNFGGATPSAPAGWIPWPGTPSSPSNSMCNGSLYYKWAASSSEVVGAWTNTGVVCVVNYRNAVGPGAVSWLGSTGSGQQIPALTLTNTNDTSWAVRFTGHRASSGTGSTAKHTTGMVTGAAGNANDNTPLSAVSWATGYEDRFCVMDSLGTLNSNLAATIKGGLGGATGYASCSAEILGIQP